MLVVIYPLQTVFLVLLQGILELTCRLCKRTIVFSTDLGEKAVKAEHRKWVRVVRHCLLSCRWDIFPAIRINDTKAKKLPANQSSPPATLKQLGGGAPSSDYQASPRGPLSVDSSEFDTNRSSGMDGDLARTFDIQDLEASE